MSVPTLKKLSEINQMEFSSLGENGSSPDTPTTVRTVLVLYGCSSNKIECSDFTKVEQLGQDVVSISIIKSHHSLINDLIERYDLMDVWPDFWKSKLLIFLLLDLEIVKTRDHPNKYTFKLIKAESLNDDVSKVSALSRELKEKIVFLIKTVDSKGSLTGFTNKPEIDEIKSALKDFINEKENTPQLSPPSITPISVNNKKQSPSLPSPPGPPEEQTVHQRNNISLAPPAHTKSDSNINNPMFVPPQDNCSQFPTNESYSASQSSQYPQQLLNINRTHPSLTLLNDQPFQFIQNGQIGQAQFSPDWQPSPHQHQQQQQQQQQFSTNVQIPSPQNQQPPAFQFQRGGSRQSNISQSQYIPQLNHYQAPVLVRSPATSTPVPLLVPAVAGPSMPRPVTSTIEQLEIDRLEREKRAFFIRDSVMQESISKDDCFDIQGYIVAVDPAEFPIIAKNIHGNIDIYNFGTYFTNVPPEDRYNQEFVLKPNVNCLYLQFTHKDDVLKFFGYSSTESAKAVEEYDKIQEMLNNLVYNDNQMLTVGIVRKSINVKAPHLIWKTTSTAKDLIDQMKL